MIYGKLDEKEKPLLSRIVSQVLSWGAVACRVPQPDQKAWPNDWRPVRGLPRVLVGQAHWHVAWAVLL